jgi:hypothetical protein
VDLAGFILTSSELGHTSLAKLTFMEFIRAGQYALHPYVRAMTNALLLMVCSFVFMVKIRG